MIYYWIQEAPSWWSAILSGGIAGALASLVGHFVTWRNTQKTLEANRRNTEKTLEENRRLQAEREHEARLLEAERAHEAALQKYFEQMRELLIEKQLRLAPKERSLQTPSDEDHDDVRLLARAQTLTVLQGLDKNQKRLLVRFLYEASLIQSGRTVVDLSYADLSGADLSGEDLRGASLRRADLRKAILSNAKLSKCLNRARLIERLSKTGPRKVDLIEHLRTTDSSKAKLIECLKKKGSSTAGLSECMSKEDLIECLAKAGLIEKVDPNEVTLKECLNRARLCDADFIEETDLSGADLREADLRETDLTQEQINEAKGNENTQLPGHLDPPEHWTE